MKSTNVQGYEKKTFNILYKIQMLTHALKNLHTNLNYQIRNIYFQALRHANAFQTASKKFDNEIYMQIVIAV